MRAVLSGRESRRSTQVCHSGGRSWSATREWPGRSQRQRSQAISNGAWDGGGHSSRDGGVKGIAGQAIEASDGDGGDGGDGGERGNRMLDGDGGDGDGDGGDDDGGNGGDGDGG